MSPKVVKEGTKKLMENVTPKHMEKTQNCVPGSPFLGPYFHLLFGILALGQLLVPQPGQDTLPSCKIEPNCRPGGVFSPKCTPQGQRNKEKPTSCPYFQRNKTHTNAPSQCWRVRLLGHKTLACQLGYPSAKKILCLPLCSVFVHQVLHFPSYDIPKARTAKTKTARYLQ